MQCATCRWLLPLPLLLLDVGCWMLPTITYYTQRPVLKICRSRRNNSINSSRSINLIVGRCGFKLKRRSRRTGGESEKKRPNNKFERVQAHATFAAPLSSGLLVFWLILPLASLVAAAL